MGIEYLLVNKKNKTLYDLAKGSWYEFIDSKEYLTDLELLKEFIFDNIFHGYESPNFTDSGESKREYTNEIATEIFEFCFGADLSDLEIINDNGDETWILHCLKYRCIGTRIRPNKEDRLEFQNRHLTDASLAHLYSIEDAKKYLLIYNGFV